MKAYAHVQKITALHVILFFLTLLSTIVAGMFQKGISPIKSPERFYEGLPFALTLLTILLAHELGHYISSVKHNTHATLPYFIPAPSIFGTFGAFIKMKSPIQTRTALLDIGASGPVIGFIFSVAASIIGLMGSKIVEISGNQGLILGDSILFTFMSKLILGTPPAGHDIMLNSVAFAGWIGLFITSLNLLPVGQLDGGHIAYAVTDIGHKWSSRVVVVVLFCMGILYWEGWLMWAFLMVVLKLHHPPVYFSDIPLDPSRKKVAFLSLLIFIVTFMPTPFIIND
ncbi:site-2 protease family protein [Candidatus Magnetomonas plexicatena]|uniref:site-2 protease family protein n=1 Tax=Candidatus Magnetomonas plexicatena TaxID=2552947 RepID=UPI0011028F89|nr:site-2 protease family protein [Nitrospirales bacterium LBB_01]